MKYIFFIPLLSFSFVLAAQDSTKTVVKNPDEHGVYTVVEKEAEFPGGYGALWKFILGHVKYPQNARENDIEGKVLVRFTIYEDGSVQDVTLVEKADPELDAEAVRVISMLPKFQPATIKSEPVEEYFTIPMMFKLP